MFYDNKIKQALLLASVLTLSTAALANECGDAPVAPELVDGASSTMDDMVANSEQVKSFIADADKYLDCREAFIATDEFSAQSEDVQNAYRADNKGVLDQRNAIGENFNAEVAAYKKANP